MRRTTIPLLTCIVSLMAAGPLWAQATTPTYAERLGWPAGTRAVIFHIDDAGMSYDSNKGAMEALDRGVATSVSVMMPCPWVPQFAAYLAEHPQVDAGVHLTLNAEWKNYRWGPVAGASVVPGLVDEHGYLWHGVQDVASHATPDEFETEIRAQVDKALALGIRPTHLDTHMGTCFQPAFLERYVKVGLEKQIPVMMFGGHMQHISGEAERFKPLIRSVAEQLWSAGLPVLDDLVTSPTRARDYEQRRGELLTLLDEMQPGVTQIIVHCTVPTEAFAHISGTGEARHAETRLMTDPVVRDFIAKEGIVLTSWRELHRRRQNVPKP